MTHDMNTLLTQFFDVTANGGWNMTAWIVWMYIFYRYADIGKN